MKTVVLASLLVAVLGTGCSIPPPMENPFPDDGVRLVQPQDLPVPSGMVLQTHLHQSHTRQVDDYRFADLVYLGNVRVEDVVSYLLARWPLHAYELKSQDSESRDQEILVFARGPYTASCTVRRNNPGARLEIKLRTHTLTP